MMRLAIDDIYDIAILVSGDSDFCDAVETVMEKGKRVINIGFPKGHSDNLRNKCDKFMLINETLLRGCWL
jgi:uncharacterized protein (TIGR00288 family)